MIIALRWGNLISQVCKVLFISDEVTDLLLVMRIDADLDSAQIESFADSNPSDKQAIEAVEVIPKVPCSRVVSRDWPLAQEV